MQILDNLTNLNISEECFQDIISLIEGELIDFQEKRKEKVLDKNAHKLANMIKNGELKSLRVLKNGELMGFPEQIKKVKDIEKENQEVGLGKRWQTN